MLHCFILFCREKKSWKSNIIDIFVIHFQFSDIFPDFSPGLKFMNDNFRDISRGWNFADGKLCITDYIFRQKPKSTEFAKYDSHQN